MRALIRTLSVLALVVAWATELALADVPTKMNVQGRLTNGSGGVVPAGLKLFTFKIFDQQVGGVEIWPAAPGETQALTTDANGLWSGSIGQLIPLTENVFKDPVRWLEVSVNDGINPPETLPRVELKTNPYTYRAATSQQADSLGGKTVGDLMGNFVDESADTMSGQLRIDWDHADVGHPNLQIDNISNGDFSGWNTSQGSWGVAIDVASDNAFWNVGLATQAGGDNTTNYALEASAYGTNSYNVAFSASAAGGTTNLAAYFDGNVQVTGSGIGDSTVKLPANAISSTEILNEPGLASQNNVIGVTPSSGTMEDVETVTLTTSTAGWIDVRGSAYGWVEGLVGNAAAGYIQIDETAGGSYTLPYVRAFGPDTKPSAGHEFYPLYCERIYFKSPGTYTFRMETARAAVTGSGGVHVVYAMVTATFYATSYGAVSTVMAADDAGEFENLTAVAQNPAGADGLPAAQPQGPFYRVDLRELELKVAREEAEAERARRELAEAQMSAARSLPQAPGRAGEEPNR